MCSKFPTAEIIKDYGSGINFKRKGLQTLLERVVRGDKLQIIVAHWNRLAQCRSEYSTSGISGEIIQFFVKQNGGAVVVLNQTVHNGGAVVVLNQTVHSPEEELTADLLAILHLFSCRMYELRRYRDQIQEDSNLTNKCTERDS